MAGICRRIFAEKLYNGFQFAVIVFSLIKGIYIVIYGIVRKLHLVKAFFCHKIIDCLDIRIRHIADKSLAVFIGVILYVKIIFAAAQVRNLKNKRGCFNVRIIINPLCLYIKSACRFIFKDFSLISEVYIVSQSVFLCRVRKCINAMLASKHYLLILFL